MNFVIETRSRSVKIQVLQFMKSGHEVVLFKTTLVRPRGNSLQDNVLITREREWFSWNFACLCFSIPIELGELPLSG